MATYLTAVKTAGLQVFHPDINHSQAGYLLQKKAILVGLSAIKGLRRDFVAAIVENQPYANLTEPKANLLFAFVIALFSTQQIYLRLLTFHRLLIWVLQPKNTLLETFFTKKQKKY